MMINKETVFNRKMKKLIENLIYNTLEEIAT